LTRSSTALVYEIGPRQYEPLLRTHPEAARIVDRLLGAAHCTPVWSAAPAE